MTSNGRFIALQGIQFLSVDALSTGKHVALGTRDGQYVDFIMRIFFIENKNRLNIHYSYTNDWTNPNALPPPKNYQKKRINIARNLNSELYFDCLLFASL